MADIGNVKDMELTAKERKEERPTILADDEGPKFPHGLRIHLNEQVIQKLGLKELPEPGAKKILLAKVTCEEVASREEVGGLDRSITIQITGMGLTPANDDSKVRSAEKSLYK